MTPTSGYPRFSPAFLTLLLVALISASIAGHLFAEPYAHLAVFAVGLVAFWLALRRGKRYRAFFAHWNTLSADARERNAKRRADLQRSRIQNALLALMTFTLVIAQVPLAVRAEIIRGANLDEPGIVFTSYNRLEAPQLAELIELYVVKRLPLDQADSSDLRLLRDLHFAIEGYHFEPEDPQAPFLGLLWYRPYRSFPNDINALPPAYRERVERILAVEAGRARIR